MAAQSLCALLLTILVVSVACEKQSIVGELLSSEYTGFVKLLEQANLLDELDAQAQKHNGLTVLPTTDNFLVNKVSPVLLSWLKKEQNVPTLRRVLLNHFVPGNVHPDSWTGKERTLNGYGLDRRMIRGVNYIGGVAVRKVAAFRAVDGIAHSLDGLLVPEDVKLELTNFLDVQDDGISKTISGIGFTDSVKITVEAEAPVSSPAPSSAEPAAAPSASPPGVVFLPAETPTSPSPPTPPSTPPAFAPAPGPSTSLSELFDALANAGGFTQFLKLLSEYGLNSTLETQLQSDTTILAPNDDAFSKVSASQLDSLTSGGNIEELLSYHILKTYATTDDFQSGAGASTTSSKLAYVGKQATSNTTQVYYYETLYVNHPLIVYVTGDVVTYGPQNATVSQANLLSNGQLSASGINGVMIPLDLIVKAQAPSSSGILTTNLLLTALFTLVPLLAVVL